MSSNYRQKLFEAYNRTHVSYLDVDDQAKLVWFLEYAKGNYLKHLDRYDRKSAKVLEIGCNRGHLLAAFYSFGFTNLCGIDLSPDDIEKAKILVPNVEITCVNAIDYLNNNQEQFDVIILKAVLEHVSKDEIIPFLDYIKKGLKPGGTVIVDVPNMDWLFAPHERYMDFTHEVGFTCESLRQIMNYVFSNVRVTPVDNIACSSRPMALKKQIARSILGKLLLWADPQGGSNPIWARSIIGVGNK